MISYAYSHEKRTKLTRKLETQHNDLTLSIPPPLSRTNVEEGAALGIFEILSRTEV